MQNLHDSDIAVNMEVSDQDCKSYNSIYVMKNTKVMKIRYLEYTFSFSFTLAVARLKDMPPPKTPPFARRGRGEGGAEFSFPMD